MAGEPSTPSTPPPANKTLHTSVNENHDKTALEVGRNFRKNMNMNPIPFSLGDD